jgi:glycosyltransferase involved in cell wall biosynthesis
MVSDKMAESLKICMLVSGPFPSIGGAEILTHDLSLTLSKKGHEVTVVCGEPDGNELILDDDFGGKIKICPILPSSGNLRFLRKVVSFYKFLMENEVDLIHAHIVIPAGVLGLIGKVIGIPIVVTAHGTDIKIVKEINYGDRLNKFSAALIWFTLKLIDSLVIVSRSMINDAIDAGCSARKLTIIYNGVDIDKYILSNRIETPQLDGISHDDFIILFLGRLHQTKCADDLIRAFPKIVQHVSNAKLVFAGKGEEEKKLKKLTSDLNLEEKVIFVGVVSGNRKWNLIKDCDVFVLPSATEGHPIAVIEAMACGKPVIATNISSFSEIIRNKDTGLLVSLHSPDELGEAIVELALDVKKRLDMGVRARKSVLGLFSIDKTANDYLELYDRLINKNRMCRNKCWVMKYITP